MQTVVRFQVKLDFKVRATHTHYGVICAYIQCEASLNVKVF